MLSSMAYVILTLILAWTFTQAQEVLPVAQIRVTGDSEDDGIIPAGTDVVLECMISGTTSPDTWNHNDMPVQSNSDFEIDGNGQLTLRGFSSSHTGNYTCVASNDVGIVSSPSIQLQLPAQEANFLSTDQSSPHRVTVTQGQAVAIPCGTYTSSPPTDLTWEVQFRDVFFALSLSHDRALVGINQSLIVVNPVGSALFRCTLDNVNQEVGYVAIEYQESSTDVPLTIVSPPQDIATPRGAHVALECIPGGTGAESLSPQWTYPNSHNRNIRPSNNGMRLDITGVVDQNVGTFTCSIPGIAEPATAQLTIIDPPMISPMLPSDGISVTYGDPIRLSCPATTSHPPMHWEWYFNGTRLAEESGSTVSIPSSTMEHSGTYQCIVYNSAGHAFSATTVTVNTLPAMITEPLPDSQLVFRNSPFTLRCSATGAPPPRYTWFKGQTPLQTNSEFEVDDMGGLTINMVEASSGGSYECRAENSLPDGTLIGSRSTTTTLTTINPTVIQRELGEMFSVQVDTSATLPCEAMGSPGTTLRYSWTKDGAPLVTSTRIAETGESGNLLVSPVEIEDAGVYQCTVRTDLEGLTATEATMSASTTLIVTATPVIPVIISLESTSSSSFTIQWVFHGATTHISNYTIEIQPSFASSSTPWFPLLTRSVGAITDVQVASEDHLEPFTEYNVRVVAAYTDGRRVASEGSLLRTGEETPEDGPTGVKGVAADNNTAILLSWGPPSLPRGAIVDYVIEFKEKDEEEYVPQSVGSNATSYSILGLKEYQIYEVRIAGVTSVGRGMFSHVIVVHTNQGGLEEPASGPFVTSIGFIALLVAVVVILLVTVVITALVIKRKATKKKEARKYHVRHSGYFGKDNVIDMECTDTNLSESTMSSYRAKRKRAFGSNSPPGEGIDLESSVGGGGTEYTGLGTPQLSIGGSSTRMILHNNAPSYIDPPSFEETVMKTRSRTHSAASASYGIENTAAMSGADWESEQETKLDFPVDGVRRMPDEYTFDGSDNSIEKNPVESVLSDDIDAFSDHTQYSHLASITPTAHHPGIITTTSTNTFHHQLNLPMSASSTESRSTPTSFSEMVQKRLSAQSMDENVALNYATYV